MSEKVLNVGQRLPLNSFYKKAMASAAIVGMLALGALTLAKSDSHAGGETRVISMIFPHTGEKLTVTYMKDGRYVPSAMKQINRLLRDWRRNEVTTIDPKTIDLVWELHADMGSKKPIHIVSGYRSPRTNAFLKRIGRKVAKKSQHMKGKAIDFYFPDISTAKIRNSALARRVGGVGYYRSAGGPSGFIHADSGNVRHWGPGMAPSQVAGLIRDGQKYVGKRMSRKGFQSEQMMLASANAGDAEGSEKSGNILSSLMGMMGKKDNSGMPADMPAAPEAVAADETNYVDDEQLADLSADATEAENAAEAAQMAKLAKMDTDNQQMAASKKSDAPATGELAALSNSISQDNSGTAAVKNGSPVVPLPRLKPATKVQAVAEARQREDEQLALAGMVIKPVSAKPDPQTWQKKPSQVANKIASLDPAEIALEDEANKTSLPNVANGKVAKTKLVEPASYDVSSLDVGSLGDSVSKSGLKVSLEIAMPRAVTLGPDGTGPATGLEPLQSAAGKGDAERVNRDGKGGLPPLKIKFSAN